MNHIFTITARNYLALALTLSESVSRFHPEISLTIIVADGLEQLPHIDLPSNHRLLDASDFIDERTLKENAFKYNITEFCTSFKPAAFLHLFEEQPGREIIFYMDPDTRLYSRLDPIVDEAAGKHIFLTPHVIDCRIEDDNPYPEYHHLWEGIFNLGFVAIRRGADSNRLLKWWDARLQNYCYADYIDGLHTDQKWMDYVPALFPEATQIVRHYGANVAHFNLIERSLSLQGERYYVNQVPLVFFHFSGFDFRGNKLNKGVGSRESRAENSELINQFAAEYRSTVFSHGFDTFIKIPYKYGAYSDGATVSAAHRRFFRAWRAEGNICTDPFKVESEFSSLLRRYNLVDLDEGAPSNYSKSNVKNLPGKIKLIKLAFRMLLRVVGFKKYAQMVKMFYHFGRYENHAFLLKK